MGDVQFRALPSNTGPVREVLAALLDGNTYAAKIIEVTGLTSGTVYRVMARLDVHGWVTSRWDTSGPTRRHFMFTEPGERAARAICGRQAPQ